THVSLIAGDFGDAGSNAELRGAAAESPDLRRRVTELLQFECPPVSVDRLYPGEYRLAGSIQHCPVFSIQGWSLSASEREDSVVILRREAVARLQSRTDAKLHDVAAVNHSGVVLQFVIVQRIEGMARLRAAAVER